MVEEAQTVSLNVLKFIYGRNPSGCEWAKNVDFLPFILLGTIYISVALMKITMCFKQVEASHIMSWDS